MLLRFLHWLYSKGWLETRPNGLLVDLESERTRRKIRDQLAGKKEAQ